MGFQRKAKAGRKRKKEKKGGTRVGPRPLPEVVDIMFPTKASRRLGRASRQLLYFVRNTMEDNWVVKCLFVINWMYQNIHVVHCSMSCLMRLQCIDLFNVQL